jgi:hypothetical protein
MLGRAQNAPADNRASKYHRMLELKLVLRTIGLRKLIGIHQVRDFWSGQYVLPQNDGKKLANDMVVKFITKKNHQKLPWTVLF